MRVAYKPTAVAYADFSDNDRIDQVASWDAGWRGKAITLAYSGEARALGDATADTGTLTDRTEFANEARISWSVRERVAVEVAAGYESTSYDDPRFAEAFAGAPKPEKSRVSVPKLAASVMTSLPRLVPINR